MNVKESVFKMKDIIKLFEDLPLIAKIILCIPVLDIVWSVYKIIRSLDKKNVLGIVYGNYRRLVGYVVVFTISSFVSL